MCSLLFFSYDFFLFFGYETEMKEPKTKRTNNTIDDNRKQRFIQFFVFRYSFFAHFFSLDDRQKFRSYIHRSQRVTCIFITLYISLCIIIITFDTDQSKEHKNKNFLAVSFVLIFFSFFFILYVQRTLFVN